MRTPINPIVKKLPRFFVTKDLIISICVIYLRKSNSEFDIEVKMKKKSLPYVPTKEELKNYYDVVWKSHAIKYIVIIKVLLYTGIRVQELWLI